MYLQQRVAYVRQLRERNRLQFQSAVEAPKANRQVKTQIIVCYVYGEKRGRPTKGGSL
jgi:hypothetical protein